MSATSQKQAFENIFSSDLSRWEFHDTSDPLTRYLRDRRLCLAMSCLKSQLGDDLLACSVLTVCGGVGGEATYFANRGFADVTNSDFSENALEVCRKRDARLKTLRLDAEAMDLPDESYDIVVVQDALHHLPRPVLGLNEMIRVARKAVVVLEPHEGLVARLFGTEWERHDDAVNYVFRWNKKLFCQVIFSQLLESEKAIQVRRVWDHNVVVGKTVSGLRGGWCSLVAAKCIYAALKPFNFLGNQLVGVLVKTASGR